MTRVSARVDAVAKCAFCVLPFGPSPRAVRRPDCAPPPAERFELVAWPEMVGRLDRRLVDTTVRVLERYWPFHAEV